MNPSGAASQTPNNIRKKVGPAVWLLALLWDSMPAYCLCACTKDTVNATQAQ
jgi:hypothetical protein